MPLSRIPPAASRLLAVLGAVGLAACALLGVAGAASRPTGIWIGLPPLWCVSIVLGAVAVLFASAGARSGLRSAAGLLVPALLLAAGAPLVGVRALSGPALSGLVLAAAAVVVTRTGWRPGSAAFLPLAFLVLVSAGGRSSLVVGPQGDEPHYLMVAESLLRDHDLSLERDYAEGRYASFHDAPLAPHYRVRGQRGEIYSLHAVGLSILILPAWALAGTAGVTVFMALLAALAAREVREWAAEVTARQDVADAAGWLFVLSPPLLYYAGLVFTEVPAALLLAFGLRHGGRDPLSARRALAVGGAAAALPWLNVRYAPLALLVVAHLVWRQRRGPQLVASVAPLLASIAGLAFYHHALYGFWDPRRVYGRQPEMALATLRDGLPGLFLDQEFGLFIYAPALALAGLGLALLWRRDRRLAAVSILAVVMVVLTAGAWHMWRGGFNPPGRFLVPIVPILVLAVAQVFDRRGLTAGAALLVGWGLWTGIAGACAPELVHRDRDDTAPFFRRLSGAREWTGLLPGYVLDDPDRDRLAAVWAVALLAAMPWRSRRAGAARVAVAGLGLVASAQLAAGLTHARTGDRDAVRLVGRPALAAAGWSVTSSVVAEWSTSALGWGPLYEPHRYPSGADLGRRLPLAPGRYRLDLDGQSLAAGAASPLLEVAPDRPGAPSRLVSLRAGPNGFWGTLDVRPGDRAVGLRLRGGGPILVRALRLSAQPSGAGTV